MDVFADYAYYYNSFYKDKDYFGEAQKVNQLLCKYGNGKNIINFGCGTGRHDAELIRMGYTCTGIDLSPQMIEMAREVVPVPWKANFSVADIRKYEPEQKYDYVISLFHVMSYQNENADVMAAFKSARKALNKGGILIFDSWYGPGVLSDKPSVRVREVEDDDNKMIRIAKPIMHVDRNVVDVYYEILVVNKKTNLVQRISETHSMRYFFKPEIESMLAACGFRLIECLDCRTLEETTFDSWTSYFVAVAE